MENCGGKKYTSAFDLPFKWKVTIVINQSKEKAKHFMSWRLGVFKVFQNLNSFLKRRLYPSAFVSRIFTAGPVKDESLIEYINNVIIFILQERKKGVRHK